MGKRRMSSTGLKQCELWKFLPCVFCALVLLDLTSDDGTIARVQIFGVSYLVVLIFVFWSCVAKNTKISHGIAAGQLVVLQCCRFPDQLCTYAQHYYNYVYMPQCSTTELQLRSFDSPYLWLQAVSPQACQQMYLDQGPAVNTNKSNKLEKDSQASTSLKINGTAAVLCSCRQFVE